eukprot:5366505-Prymnesium_polylepis.1
MGDSEITVSVYNVPQPASLAGAQELVTGRRRLIGQYSVAAQNIYFQEGHEIWRTWVAITHYAPGDDAKTLVHGYLRLSMTLLGPGDEPVWHDPREDTQEDESGI